MQSRSQWDSEKVSVFLDYFHILFLSKIFQPRKLLKVGQTTTLCHARLYIFFTLRRLLCLFGPGITLDSKQGLCFLSSRFPL